MPRPGATSVPGLWSTTGHTPRPSRPRRHRSTRRGRDFLGWTARHRPRAGVPRAAGSPVCPGALLPKHRNPPSATHRETAPRLIASGLLHPCRSAPRPDRRHHRDHRAKDHRRRRPGLRLRRLRVLKGHRAYLRPAEPEPRGRAVDRGNLHSLRHPERPRDGRWRRGRRAPDLAVGVRPR